VGTMRKRLKIPAALSAYSKSRFSMRVFPCLRGDFTTAITDSFRRTRSRQDCQPTRESPLFLRSSNFITRRGAQGSRSSLVV
jgi:hypothetical protein